MARTPPISSNSPSLSPSPGRRPHRVLGRYALHDEIAAGGMAVVHFGRLLGPVGFARTVAIKRLHPYHAHDPEFVTMFLDEARLASRIRHPNVVPTIDVVDLEGEVFLVMEYVHGETLSRLARAAAQQKARVPLPIAVAVMVAVLHGLHAAHEAHGEQGQPLDIIHRDVSPQNILVGEDGIARLADFGIAKASWRAQSTREGQFKGKLPYMAPEQIARKRMDRRVDVYAAGVVLWELLAGRRLFDGDNPASIIEQVMHQSAMAPSRLVTGITAELDVVTLKALARSPGARFETAREMAIALEEAAKAASAREVGDWVSATAGDSLRRRAAMLSQIEHSDQGSSSGGTVASIAERPVSELRTLTTKSSLFSSITQRQIRGRGRAIGVGVLALGLAVIAVSTVMWNRSVRPSSRPLVVAAPSTAASAPVLPIPPTPPTPSVPEQPSSATSVPDVEPPPSASGETPAAPPHKEPARIGAASATPKHKPNCNPAFTLDGDGVRIPKPGCY